MGGSKQSTRGKDANELFAKTVHSFGRETSGRCSYGLVKDVTFLPPLVRASHIAYRACTFRTDLAVIQILRIYARVYS